MFVAVAKYGDKGRIYFNKISLIAGRTSKNADGNIFGQRTVFFFASGALL